MRRIGIILGLLGSLWAQETPAKETLYQSRRKPLFPEVELSGRRSPHPTAPTKGITVYNTTVAGKGEDRVYPGFYRWNGEIWERVIIYPKKPLPLKEGYGGSLTALVIMGIEGTPYTEEEVRDAVGVATYEELRAIYRERHRQVDPSR